MSHSIPSPTDIELHQQERRLHIAFDDNRHFDLPCEYLRVYSPSAENRQNLQQKKMLKGKETVNIKDITPVGTYAVKLEFDDGHDTGVYSWESLYTLGVEQENNWQAYLDSLEAQNYQRVVEGEDSSTEKTQQKASVTLNMIYFVGLVKLLGLQEETLYAPPTVKNVHKLFTYLRGRGGIWASALKKEQVQVTVNREFADWDTPLKDGDEIGVVPRP